MKQFKEYFFLFWGDTKKIWNYSPVYSAAIVFSLVAAAYSSIFLTTPGISFFDDHFFHFEFANLFKEKGIGISTNFHWIHFYRHSQYFSSCMISLFHIFLVPFTFVSDKVLGLKIAGVFGASLTTSILYYVLRKFKIKYSFFYILVLLSSTYFIERLVAGRGFVLTVGLIFLEAYLAINKKHAKFFWVSFFHVLWHPSSFFVPFLIAATAEMSRYFAENRFAFKNFFAALAGIFLGSAFFPGFPANIWRWTSWLIGLQGNIMTKKVMQAIEGNELLPFGLERIINSFELFFLLLVAGFGVSIFFYTKQKRKGPAVLEDSNHELFFFSLLCLFFFLGSLVVSGRFVDYLLPAIIFLAAIAGKKMVASKYLTFSSPAKKIFIASFSVFFVLNSMNSFLNYREDFYRTDYESVGKASEWIKSKSNEKDVVYLFNWNEFPIAFFYNSKNEYIMGMEPKYLLDYDPKLFWKWYNLNKNSFYCEEEKDCAEEKKTIVGSFGENKEALEEFDKENSRKMILSVKNDFDSRYILTASEDAKKFLSLNEDMIADSFETRSERLGQYAASLELK